MHYSPHVQLWNSEVSEGQRRNVLSELASEEPSMRLLYTTPESLRNPTLKSYLQVTWGAAGQRHRTALPYAEQSSVC